jgi:L-aminopeptidase/D-esterase-like protein
MQDVPAPGPRNLITDVPGLLVGSAEDAGLRSGATVLTAEAPFLAAVHVMGGAPGARETDLLAPDALVDRVDALALSGGSAFGLDAASGVSDALRAAGRGFETAAGAVVPIVPGAILFDLANGGAHGWTTNPYRALGAAAFAAAAPDIRARLGRRGLRRDLRAAARRAGLGVADPAFGRDGGRAGRGQRARLGGGRRRPAFLGRALRDRRRVRRARPGPRRPARRRDLPRQAQPARAGRSHHHRHRRHRRGARQGAGETHGGRRP